MGNIKSNEEKPKASKSDNNFIFAMIFLYLAIPLFAALNIFELRPQGVTHGEWIQRSGALMVICAIYVDSTKNRISDKNPDFKKSKMCNFLNYIYPALLIAGTFVWGYMDII